MLPAFFRLPIPQARKELSRTEELFDQERTALDAELAELASRSRIHKAQLADECQLFKAKLEETNRERKAQLVVQLKEASRAHAAQLKEAALLHNAKLEDASRLHMAQLEEEKQGACGAVGPTLGCESSAQVAARGGEAAKQGTGR